VVSYGAAEVRLYARADGATALSWREGGRARRTTRADRDKALRWAAKKVRELEKSTGARWVTPASAERLRAFEKLVVGTEGEPVADAAGRLLVDLQRAREVLGGSLSRVLEACRWFADQGPGAVVAMTLEAAVEAFLLEYARHHPSETLRPVRSELRSLLPAEGSGVLLGVSLEVLDAHVRRLVDGEERPADRTVGNRIAHWTLFFNHAQARGWWPEGRRHPAMLLKRPRKKDRPVGIFSPEEGEKLLQLVLAEQPQNLTYVLMAGWLGLRPSECARVGWDAFDFEAGHVHLSQAVVQKTLRERWVPLCPALVEIFRHVQARPHLFTPPHWRAKKGRVCRSHAQEHVSALFRAAGERWEPDVLRHSRVTYRLQVLGGDVDRVAEESGNSPEVVRSDYKRPIRPGEGERWFEVLGRLVL
jgi:integrase